MPAVRTHKPNIQARDNDESMPDTNASGTFQEQAHTPSTSRKRTREEDPASTHSRLKRHHQNDYNSGVSSKGKGEGKSKGGGGRRGNFDGNDEGSALPGVQKIKAALRQTRRLLAKVRYLFRSFGMRVVCYCCFCVFSISPTSILLDLIFMVRFAISFN